MSQTKPFRTAMHYSRTDNSWYGWWADGEPATIPAARMEAAYLELFRTYQQQGMTPVEAGRQAHTDVHNMTYWHTHATAGWIGNIRSIGSGLVQGPPATRPNAQFWMLFVLAALWCLLLAMVN
jgi:hypothetical protein